MTIGMAEALPFTVVGGYLGAGKTTLLNHLLSNAGGLRVAVLVNDFGSVNIDAELIRRHDGATIDLANGCMCCSLVNGFAQAVGHLRARAADFDQVVIEASGVSDPAKIAQYGQMYELPLDGILVVVDAEQVRTQADNKYVGDTVERQLAQADLLVINKTDLLAPADLASLRTWLGARAPGTPMVETVRSEVPMAVLLGSRRGSRADLSERVDDHRPDHRGTYGTWTLEWAEPLPRAALARFSAGLGEDIYRVKGFVDLQDDPHRRQVYQQVGVRWTLEPGAAWGEDPRRTRLVVIGRAGAVTAEGLAALVGRSDA